MVQLSHLCITTGNTIALTIQTFVSKVISLLFNTLSRFVIAFLPRSKHLLISQLQSPFTVILEPLKNKICHCFHFFPIYLPWSDGTGCHDLSFFMLSFKPAFSLSSFTLIKRHFSSSSTSAIRVVSSAYLRLSTFLLAILIPACDSSSPAFIHLPPPPPHYVGGWRGPRSSILGLASTTMTTCSVSGQPWCPLSSLVIWKKVFPNLPAVSVGPEREADPSQLPHRHFHDKKLVEKRRHGVLFVKDF